MNVLSEKQKQILDNAHRIIKEDLTLDDFYYTCLKARLCPNDGSRLKEELHRGFIGGAIFLKCNECEFDVLKPKNI